VPYHLRHERVGPLLENERRWGKVHDDFKREKAASALKGDSATGNRSGGDCDSTTQLGGVLV
jgi:hypothetical protein